jgi:GGDEF domain-containing protein
MDFEKGAPQAAAQDLRAIAANTARDLALGLRLASRRMESFEPGQGKDAARELAEQLSASARRAVELYYLESLTQAVAISEGPVKLRRRNEADELEQQGELFDIQRLKSDVSGCYNKVGFTLLLECELERARRRKLPVSIALFKLEVPDEAVVREVAKQGRECCRLLDVLGIFDRRGVGMLLPDTGVQGTQVAAQRVLTSYFSVRDIAEAREPRGELRVGVASCPEDGYDPGLLLKKADERAGGGPLISDR